KTGAPEPKETGLEKKETQTGPKAVLTVNIGRVRDTPSTNAEVKFKLYRGNTVSVIETEKDWLLIVTEDGNLGWAHQSLFTKTTGPSEPGEAGPEKQETEKSATLESGKPLFKKPETETGQKVTLKVKIGRVREMPSTDAEVKFRLVRGDIVSVVETKDNWYLIKTEDGNTGWAHQNLFSEPQRLETAPKTGATDDRLAPEAREMPEKPEPAKIHETPDIAETPEKFESYDIKEIEFIITPEGEEVVTFLLTGYYPPKTFSVVKDRPKVICDFFGAKLETGIERFQELNGDFIHQIRIGIHKGSRSKVRVIIDLVPDETYDIRPVFFKEDNLYTLIVARKK
ncbi:MAG: SH3 domain-containing protein, partial [Deltaproteobacteria bacterium]|nr:SH3 domain-containing protein [Deltaproteobacteria bacterium]